MTSGTQRSEGPFGSAMSSWANYSDLVMYARRVLGDKSDTAEDVVQEAYLRLLGLAASDEAPDSARPWLFRVVRNLAIDERRSAARRADPVADTAILGTAAADDTAGLVETRHELEGALREVAALPPRERRVIEMDQAGIGAQEIADELGTTPNAVHQALFRARARLRNARAVAWGLIPVAIAPMMIKLADPALAVSITNLPPGMPVGRALPVAGLVAAAMVSGSVVAPSLNPSSLGSEGIQFGLPTITAPVDTPDDSDGRTPATSDDSSNSGPSENSGKGKAEDADDDNSGSQNRGRNRGSGSSGDDAEGGADDSGKGQNRGPGKAPATGGSADDGPDDDGSGKQRGKGSGNSGGGGSADDSPDTPDEPDND